MLVTARTPEKPDDGKRCLPHRFPFDEDMLCGRGSLMPATEACSSLPELIMKFSSALRSIGGKFINADLRAGANMD